LKYFKKSELVKLYNVSDKTVRNWIEATKSGKLNLELYEKDGKSFIADTVYNYSSLMNLATRSRKYRNSLNHHRVEPLAGFYQLYSFEEIIDIVNNLEMHREIPQQYRYCGTPAATYWNEYLLKLDRAGSDNMLSATQELLQLDLPYIDKIAERHASINVVDVGVGNGLAVKAFLGALQRTGKLKKYVGIDISLPLLDTTRENIATWFSGNLETNLYRRDITHQRFAEAIVHNMESEDTINIVLFLGGILGNFKAPGDVLRVIRDSMGSNDILIMSDKLDNEYSRRFFDFNIESDKSALPFYSKYILDLLGLKESYYRVEQQYELIRRQRTICIRLTSSLSLSFDIGRFNKVVEMQKGERILLWRGGHFTTESSVGILSSNGFEVLRSTKVGDKQEFSLFISKVKKISSSESLAT
jgi:uncharacterized SAM-dependent methyltransferase